MDHGNLCSVRGAVQYPVRLCVGVVRSGSVLRRGVLGDDAADQRLGADDHVLHARNGKDTVCGEGRGNPDVHPESGRMLCLAFAAQADERV